jgi:hypothetical protein
MYKFSDLSFGAFLLLFIVLLIQIYYFYDFDDEIDNLTDLDFDGNGKVSRQELKYYLKLVEDRTKKKKIKWREAKENIFAGVIRGFLMGFILNSVEGGLTLALILGVINPVISCGEKVVF